MAKDEWTLDSVRIYLESMINILSTATTQRFSDSDKAVNAALLSADKAVTAALIASEKAVNKAELASEKRFDAVNEFRAQLSDQAATFISRGEYVATLNGLTEKIDSLQARMDKTEGSSKGISSTVAVVLTIVPIVVAIIAVIAVIMIR